MKGKVPSAIKDYFLMDLIAGSFVETNKADRRLSTPIDEGFRWIFKVHPDGDYRWKHKDCKFPVRINVKKTHSKPVEATFSCFSGDLEHPFWKFTLRELESWQQATTESYWNKSLPESERKNRFIKLVREVQETSLYPSFGIFLAEVQKNLNNKMNKAIQERNRKSIKNRFWQISGLTVLCLGAGIYWFSQDQLINTIAIPFGWGYFAYSIWKKNPIEEHDDTFDDLAEELSDKANEKLVEAVKDWF